MEIWYAGRHGNNHHFEILKVERRFLEFTLRIDGKIHEIIETYEFGGNVCGDSTFKTHRGLYVFPKTWGVKIFDWPRFERPHHKTEFIRLSYEQGRPCYLSGDERDWLDRMIRCLR